MPQNADINSNPDGTDPAVRVTGSNNPLLEPPDPPDQNNARIVEFGQRGDENANLEAQASDVHITATTTTIATTDNNNEMFSLAVNDEHANERHAKRKAIDAREDEVDTEIMAIHRELRNEENTINAVQGRLEADETALMAVQGRMQIDEDVLQNFIKRFEEFKTEQEAKTSSLEKLLISKTDEITTLTKTLAERTTEQEAKTSSLEKLLISKTDEITTLTKANAELTSKIDYLTLKDNDTGRKLRALEQTRPESQSWAQAANTLTKKVGTISNNQKTLAERSKVQSQAISMALDHNRALQKQVKNVKKSINETGFTEVPMAHRSPPKTPCITIAPSERLEAIKAENRTDREVKKIIDKEISPSIVVGVNFTARGNLTLRIKDMNNETMNKLNTFGNVIDNETWHKVILDGVQKCDLVENGELVNAEELKTEIEDRNNVRLACPPHAIRTDALKGDKTNCFSLVVAFRSEYECRNTLKHGIYFVNQHCHARKWSPKPPTTATKPNEQNKPTDVMEVDNNEPSQSYVNNDQ